MSKIIDIRSDTVTQPTPEMRRVMAEAPVGDDVYGDDPTVNRLEALAAEKAGKEAAMFVPSGTMGNQLAIMTHTKRGDDVICGRNSHVFVHEVGAASILSGVILNPVDSKDDVIYPGLLEKAIREDDIHCPPTTLLCIENALATGMVVPLDVMEKVYNTAKAHGLNVHMDGARLFNAAAALGVPATEITKYTDTVMFCLSKGLCAPVGSILAGSREFIDRARKNRKILGGGMRQCGILAAAGILALTEMPAHLAVDHENAAWLRQRLAKIPGVQVKEDGIQINMVFFTLDHPMEVIESLPEKFLERGVKINGISAGEMRFVTNHDVTREDLAYVADCLEEFLK
ncbi:MAG: low-specificity L-threonine aldolase [Angelakisella sp.]|nr:low-specificity L-threonine aldolase [Angelakisella sp.]